MRTAIITSALFCCFFTNFSFGQAQKGWELGGFLGFSSYYGDLNSLFSFRRIGPSAGFFARKNFDGRICLRIMGSYANVGGDDATSESLFEKARNLSFSSNVFEGSALVEFNFQDFHGNTRDDKPIAPYLLAGVGLFTFDPMAKYQGKYYRLQPLGTEGQSLGEEYSLVGASILLGGGVKFELNPLWSIEAEIIGRVTTTDYLDDVSGVYADYRSVGAYHSNIAGALSDRSVEVGERIGLPGSQRGNSKNNDSYIFTTVSIVYRFMPLECPAYR